MMMMIGTNMECMAVGGRELLSTEMARIQLKWTPAGGTGDRNAEGTHCILQPAGTEAHIPFGEDGGGHMAHSAKPSLKEHQCLLEPGFYPYHDSDGCELCGMVFTYGNNLAGFTIWKDSIVRENTTIFLPYFFLCWPYPLHF